MEGHLRTVLEESNPTRIYRGVSPEELHLYEFIRALGKPSSPYSMSSAKTALNGVMADWSFYEGDLSRLKDIFKRIESVGSLSELGESDRKEFRSFIVNLIAKKNSFYSKPGMGMIFTTPSKEIAHDWARQNGRLVEANFTDEDFKSLGDQEFYVGFEEQRIEIGLISARARLRFIDNLILK